MKTWNRLIWIMLCAAIPLCGKAQETVVTLDLTKAVTEMTFDADNGAWNGTFDTSEEVVESQCFLFLKNCNPDYAMWWGFTASNSTDNTKKDDTMTYQYSSMTGGGIVLNEDGTIKRDENGVIEVSGDVPYMVGYYSEYNGENSTCVLFNDGKAHEAVGVYVSLVSYPYYVLQDGNPFGRMFNRENDKFTLTIHGVKEDESKVSVDVELGSYANGDMTLTRGWKYVDLSPLGKVNEMYFTMTSSDTGQWGMNTPGYFSLDKLMVKTEVSNAPENKLQGLHMTYDRSASVVALSEAAFAVVYNTQGHKVIATEGTKIDLSNLDSGIYVVKAGEETIKVVK